MKKIQFAFTIGSILLASRGTCKKLKAANTSNEELAGQINGLNAKVAEVENIYAQLK